MAEQGTNIEKLIRQAEAALEQNDSRTGRKLLDNIAEIEPDHPRLAGLWEELAAVKAYSQAVSAIKRVRYDILVKILEQWPPTGRNTPRFVELQTTLEQWIEKNRIDGEQFQEEGKWDEASEAWTRILEIDPENQRAKRRLRNCTIAFHGAIAEEFMAEGDWENAMYKWQDILRQYPESDEARKGIRRAEEAHLAEHRKKMMISWSIGGVVIAVIIGFLLYWQMVYLPEQHRVAGMESRIRAEVAVATEAPRADVAAVHWNEAMQLIDSLRLATSDSGRVRRSLRYVQNERARAERLAAWRDSVMAHEAMAAKVTAALTNAHDNTPITTSNDATLRELRELTETVSTGFQSRDSVREARRRRRIVQRRQDSLRAVRRAIERGQR